MQIIFWIIIVLFAFAISEVACIDCEELAKNSRFNANTQTLVYIYIAIKTIILVVLVFLAVLGIRIGI